MNVRSLHFRLVVWYAFWLGAVFIIAGGLLYFGLRSYLENNLGLIQRQRAERIATLLTGAEFARPGSLAEEVRIRFAPEASGRFVRISRSDQAVLFESKTPHDESFDPAQISPPPHPPGLRKERLSSGAELMVATVVARGLGTTSFLVESGESLVPALKELRRLRNSLCLGFLVVAGLAFGGGSFLVRRALRPVEGIIDSAERISSTNLSERLPAPPTGDEFEHLSHALNRMIARLEEAFQHNSRFLADASHELRTPLTVLRGELESFVQEKGLGPEEMERLGSALEEVERLAKIVEGLFAIARLDAGEAQAEWARFDLAHMAESTADQMFLLADDKGVGLSCAATESVWVEGDRARLKQVVVNLLDNAIKYTPKGGAVRMNVVAAQGKAALEVIDNGIGIPNDALLSVFDRFFRVEKARSRELGGAGLGLSIVKSICAAHGGLVEVTSEIGKGSCFRVELPLASASGDKTKQTNDH